MKKLILFFSAVASVSLLGAADMTVENVHSSMKRAADWQIQNPKPNRSIRDWTMAPYYDGLIAAARTTGDAKYLEEVLRFGDSAGWTLGNRKYHADDHAVGNAWLEVYIMDKGRNERLKQVSSSLSKIIVETKDGDIDKATSGKLGAWHWCDALYMGPRVYAKLYKITNDAKYLDYMDAEYVKSYEGLYDRESKLFYRDSKYVGKKTENGKKVFWSRGDGWVIAGLCSILDDIPQDYKSRPFYENLYMEMAASLLSCQLEDGSWPMNLADANEGQGESSGTAFFAYAFAWGANNGMLGKEYKSAALKSWNWLLSNQWESGQLVNVQPIGEDPKGYNKRHSESYGTGAFLMAGEQIAKMLGAKQEISDKDLYVKASEMYFNRTPEAFVKIEPRRADDIGWENDKCAFRMYGPALEKSVENGGIDIWGKTVDYPILSRWYDAELRHGKSYHDDHGEGKDSYSVGDRVGCGGDLLIVDGKKVRSNIYRKAEVYWTKRDSLHFALTHVYEVGEGEYVTEVKDFKMKLGDYHFNVDAYLGMGNSPETISKAGLKRFNGKFPENIVPAFGIRLQEAKAPVNGEDNYVFVDDKMAGRELVQFAWASKDFSPKRIETKDLEALISVTPTTKEGRASYSYKAGYTFGARKDFFGKDAVEEMLKKADF